MDVRPTRREFKKWRKPIRGRRNPQRMNNPFWLWCIQSGLSAYQANQEFSGPDSMSKGPCWCFDRLGQAVVDLPDGRTVYIAGEHEDYYDPDFYIYNDVVVKAGEEIEVFGYPESSFPPTDFHSATSVGSEIMLIGNLGYPESREIGKVQVLRLNPESWEIGTVITEGELPGWIHEHSAELSKDSSSIVISGGKRFDERILENFDDYELCLSTLRWQQLTQRNWKSWLLERVDQEANQIWQIRSEVWNRKLNLSMDQYIQETFKDLPADVVSELIPQVSDRQMELIKSLYQSPFDSSPAIEDEEQLGRFRIGLDGVTIRMDEDSQGVTVTVEGNLSKDQIEVILSNLLSRLSDLEGSQYKATLLQG